MGTSKPPLGLVRLHFWLAVAGVLGVSINGTTGYEVLGMFVFLHILVKKTSYAPAAVVASVIFCACTVAQAQQQSARPEPSVELPSVLARVLTDYEAAWRNRDAAGLARLFADDRIVVPNACPPVKGRAAVEHCYAGQGGSLSLRAIAYGTDGALGYIIGAYSPQQGQPDAGKFTLTLLRGGDGRWLIVSDMDRPYRR